MVPTQAFPPCAKQTHANQDTVTAGQTPGALLATQPSPQDTYKQASWPHRQLLTAHIDVAPQAGNETQHAASVNFPLTGRRNRSTLNHSTPTRPAHCRKMQSPLMLADGTKTLRCLALKTARNLP
jgi:hypothetical protein